ncbi:MAG: PIG-L deacetylase family protein [Chloroflexota bacterium]
MNILTIIAHPDDETMLTGGALALLAQAGASVHYLCATRGEGGELGEPPLCTRADLGDLREQEMRCAVQTLGGASIEFLDYVDPLIGKDQVLHPYTDDFEGLVTQIIAHLQRVQPVAVITHGSSGEYGHPAHQLTHQATRKAVESLRPPKSSSEGCRPLLYTFSAAFPRHPRPRLANENDPAHIVLDITPVFQQKLEAALCHRTQHALFVRRSSIEAGRQLTISEVVMKLEGLHRAYPPINSQPDDAVVELLKPWTKGFTFSLGG